jgi:5-hydroxyisourate hydrolase-like protein (transthyretin family)
MTQTTLAISLTNGPAKVGTNYAITGHLQESGSGKRIDNVEVTLKRRTKETPWETIETKNTNDEGNYDFSRSEQNKGVYEYQTHFARTRNWSVSNPPDFWESTVSDILRVRVRQSNQILAYEVISVLCVATVIALILVAQTTLRAFAPNNIVVILSLLIPVVVIAIALFCNAWLVAGHSKRNVIAALGFIDLVAGAAILLVLAYAVNSIYQFFAWLFFFATTAILFFGLAHVCLREHSGPRNIFDASGFLILLAGAVYFALTGIYVNRLVSWLLLMLAFSVLIFYLGPIVFSTRGNWHLRGLDWYGVLVDGRNRVSLVRFQMVIWTILVIATFAEAALANVASGAKDPVFIVTIPNNLWLLLGISVTALPVTLLATRPSVNADPPRVDDAIALRKAKEQAASESQEIDQSDAILNRAVLDTSLTKKAETSVRLFKVTQPNGDVETVILQGVAAARPRVEDARLKDMFTGDEIANYGYLDPSKVQLFVFNIMLILVYAVALGSFFMKVQPTYTVLPNVPDTLAVFLGVSNGAYLTYKAAPLF